MSKSAQHPPQGGRPVTLRLVKKLPEVRPTEAEMEQALRYGRYELAEVGQLVTFNPFYYPGEKSRRCYVVAEVAFVRGHHGYRIHTLEGKILTNEGLELWHADVFAPYRIEGRKQFINPKQTRPLIS